MKDIYRRHTMNEYNPKLARYNEVKDEMETGDLLQWKTNTWLMAVYRFLISSKVNHSSLILRLREYEAIDGRRFTTEAKMVRGTVLNLLSRQLEHHNGEVWWYRLNRDWGRENRKKIGEELLKLIGRPYDYRAVLKSTLYMILRENFGRVFSNMPARLPEDADNLFCSEYCYMAYEATGKPLLMKGAPHPRDIVKLGIFDKIEKIFPAEPVGDGKK